ncbi:MAG: endonuclease/exonuclease/phosphatase family protein [Myxococcales bacterium]|nr:endonuclease/exonuclease/phosphatase family protein [Myxococcales bacterium]
MRFIVSTWNCFGAAQTARAWLRWKGSPDAHRFTIPEVVRAVERPDILCMQEIYVSDAELFFDRLSHDHKTRDPNHSTLWPLTFGGSGLGLASRFEIATERVHAFSRPQLGTERFGRKGMLHARLRMPAADGAELDLVTTHMQSGYGRRPERVRGRQLAELRRLVDEVGSPERAFIVCGDLNIDGLSHARAAGEYAALAAALSDFVDLGAPEDRPTFHPDPVVNPLAHRYEKGSPHQRIDYVFFRAPATRLVRAEGCRRVLDQPFHHAERGPTFASDHFALEATFEVGTRH